MFKSILVAATFFASPGASQVLGNWDILYRSLATDFQHSVTNELRLDYHIGKGRTYQVDLYEKNCVGSITGMTIIPTTSRTTGVTANHDELEIMIEGGRRAPRGAADGHPPCGRGRAQWSR